VELADGSSATVRPLGEGSLILPVRRAASGRGRLHLTLLGRDRVELRAPGVHRRLTARHGELVALLALHPDGLDARTLAELLYREPGHEITVRAELHRLRALLGGALATRPYRLIDVASDLAEVQRHLAEHRVSDARSTYAGPLLPGSRLPAIVAARQRLAERLAPDAAAAAPARP
jgi:hypothetical protein